MRTHQLRSATILAVVLFFSASSLWAQFGLGKLHKENKEKSAGSEGKEKVAGSVEKAPEFTENDKRKMSEIAERPEIKDEIQAAWDVKRKADLEYAYNVNTSVRFADIAGPQFVDFRLKYGQLYDNPILQRYLNNIGQRLVPKDSPNVYSFKILLDPIPRAEAFSTGSVYVSTGLVALLDNEAQLAYIMGHEIAHVEKNHFYSEIRSSILERELNKEKEKDVAKKRAIFSVVASGIGAGIGGGLGGVNGALGAALFGGAGASVASLMLFRSKTTDTEWSDINENQADEAGLKYMLDQTYDAREIPRLYARLNNLVTRDSRVGLGFVGRLSRVRARTAMVQNLLNGSYKANIDSKLKGAGLIGSTPEFPLLVSALKRDNGVIALDYDLFAIARDNLEEAVNLRSNDARAQLYLGKVISLTSRTPADRQEALGHFLKAIQYDSGRGAYPDPHLEHALHLAAQNSSGDRDEIRRELQTYVTLFQREHSGALPYNMHIIYDYFSLAGDTNWYVPPAAQVSTRYVEALSVSTGGSSTSPGVKKVLERSVDSGRSHN